MSTAVHSQPPAAKPMRNSVLTGTSIMTTARALAELYSSAAPPQVNVDAPATDSSTVDSETSSEARACEAS